jgi:MYXO-CTERM domain-containing protein
MSSKRSPIFFHLGGSCATLGASMQYRLRPWSLALVTVLGALGCTNELPPSIGVAESELEASVRRERAGIIRDVAAEAGIENGWLIAGIANNETGLAHCWSELTWACQGPNSPECGGGPVVAGSGDGPCPQRQGGLGLFQFDGGTYDQTLARDGEGILSVRGSAQHAIEFVVGMVIRSTYIEGVDNDAEAIEWMNGVAIGNERWIPWISTVVRHYNGCQTTRPCWEPRFANYRDETIAIYDEFGPDFWSSVPEYAATFVSQSFPLASDAFAVEAGELVEGYFELRNTGSSTWRMGEVFLDASPEGIASPLASDGWITPTRPVGVDHDTAPGDSALFSFTVRAPNTPGEYRQLFTLTHEGSQFGAPGDGSTQLRLTSVGVAAVGPAEPPTGKIDGLPSSTKSDGTKSDEVGRASRPAPTVAGCSAGRGSPSGRSMSAGWGLALVLGIFVRRRAR